MHDNATWGLWLFALLFGGPIVAWGLIELLERRTAPLATLWWQLRTRRRNDDVEDLAVGHLHAWKATHLVADPDTHRVQFTGIASPARWNTTSTATCDQHRHTAPSRWCVCGHYATYTPEAARHHASRSPRGSSPVLLEVAMSGLVIEHTRGLRAQHQTVCSIHLPAGCHSCAAAATHMSGSAQPPTRHQATVAAAAAGDPLAAWTKPRRSPTELADATTGLAMLEATCRPCANESDVSFTAAELAVLLDVPVHTTDQGTTPCPASDAHDAS